MREFVLFSEMSVEGERGLRGGGRVMQSKEVGKGVKQKKPKKKRQKASVNSSIS